MKCLLMLFIIALSLHGLVIINSDTLDDMEWEAFKTKYNKSYETPVDEAEAKENFKQNQHDHYMHNLNDSHNYTQDIHEHSDKTPAEAIEVLCGTDVPPEGQNVSRRSLISSRQLTQTSVDWVAAGRVSDVKHQGQCGSCWAFTAAQTLEGQIAGKYGKMYTISKQQLVDCSSDYGNDGCDGGWPDDAFDYMTNEGGAVIEDCYPYTGKVGTCSIKSDCYRFEVKGYVGVGPSGDEKAVANALAQYGPLSIAIHVDEKMLAYSDGIYHSDDCNHDVNHGVVLVGYGTDDGQDYWKIKNSWGPSWGEKGYIRIARNQNNMCEVCTHPSFPVLA